MIHFCLHSHKRYIHVCISIYFALSSGIDRILCVLGAGINDNSTTARTLWPLDGGSLNFTLHDDAAYISVNIGLGVNTTNFNITLFSAPLNETGPGNVCFPKLQLPADFVVAEGTLASIQIATTSNSGEGLYNVRTIIIGSASPI